MLEVRLTAGVGDVWDVVARANRYLVEKEPWKLAKDPDRREELAGILYASAEVLRILAILIQPIMPSAAQRLWDQLGIGGDVENRRVPADLAWGGLAPGTRTIKGESLFPRLETDVARPRTAASHSFLHWGLTVPGFMFHVKLPLFTGS